MTALKKEFVDVSKNSRSLRVISCVLPRKGLWTYVKSPDH